MGKRVIVSGAAMVIAIAALLTLAGCPSEPAVPKPKDASGDQPALGAEGAKPAKIELTSAFEPGQPIPAKYAEDGEDVSPPLSWSGVPEGTKELALICDDPDAPSPKRPRPEPWVHWVLYKIPPDCQTLPEGIPTAARLDNPPGALQGNNSWPAIGYRGPAPPPGSGTHRYFFTLYALDTELEIEPEADKAGLLEAMSGRVIGQGELMGTYER